MTQLSIQQAADRAGVTRQTIYKKVSSGELSSTVDHRGNKQIDITELLRVFGNLSSSDSQAKATVHKQRHVKSVGDNNALQLDLERAQMQLQLKERELQLAEERIADLKAREAESKGRERSALEEKQQLLAIIDRQTLLLAAPSPEKASARPKAAAVAKPKPKPQVKDQVTKTAEKPATARKTAPAKVVAKSTTKTPARPVAWSKPATAKPAAKIAKKATRK